MARRVKEVASRPSLRPWLLGLAAVTFVAMTVVSFRSLPESGRSAQPLLVAVLVVLAAPATLSLNALEYRAMAASLGHQVGMVPAMRVAMTASLANYLPAPGGVGVRTAALKGRGSSVGSALSINAFAGLMWMAVAALIAGVMLAMIGSVVWGGGLIVAGMAILVGLVLWVRRGGGTHSEVTYVRLLLVESAIVVMVGLRLWVALAAIGQAAGAGRALVISSSTVLASAIGIFPAGLGLREALGGGLAVAVDVPVAAAVAAMAVDRMCGQGGLAVCAVLLNRK